MEELNKSFTDLTKRIEEAVITKMDNTIAKELASFRQELSDIREQRPLTVQYNAKVATVTGFRHRQLADLLNLTTRNLDLLLTGSAGTGKTHAARQVAEALSLPFYCQSVGAQTSKSDLLGFIDATGAYRDTAFRRAYENGGVYVMDEIDAGNANVLIVLNSALSNSICAFPDKMVERHADFKFIATANTYGNGASRQYVGRNQLDAATLDRFTVLDWQLDDKLEQQMVAPYKFGKDWLNVVRQVRAIVEEQEIRAIISPRASLHGAIISEPNNKERKRFDKKMRQELFQLVIAPSLPANAVQNVAKQVEIAYADL